MTLCGTKFCIQAAFGPNNWDRKLKFGMQPLIVVIYMDMKKMWDQRSLTCILTSMNLENTWKYHFLQSNSIIQVNSDLFPIFLPLNSSTDIDTYIRPPFWPAFNNNPCRWLQTLYAKFQPSISNIRTKRSRTKFGVTKCWIGPPPFAGFNRSYSANMQPIWKRWYLRGAWNTLGCSYSYLN